MIATGAQIAGITYDLTGKVYDMVAAGNFSGESAAQMVAEEHADIIAFGRLFISNPDLPERLQVGAELTPYNRPTFYSQGPVGYVDYPPMKSKDDKG